MIGDRTVRLIYDERMLEHRPDMQQPFLDGRLNGRIRNVLEGLGVEAKWTYPEHPGRITAVRELLRAEPVPGVYIEGGRCATEEELGRVHTMSYLENIEELRGQQAWLDMDTTAVSPGSVDAAAVAAGSCVSAVDAVCGGQADAAFVVCRPPGHHANAVRARGFCLYNNIAVAAAHAQAQWDLERVLIVDWDAHHGNGTQDIFSADPSVLFFDSHRAAPFYPGTGRLQEVGDGLGEGTTVNVPLPDDTGDLAMLRAYQDILVPAAEWFRPDIVLVSCGLDAHRSELCMNLSFDGFSALAGVVQQIADRHCHGRLVMALEGGYNPDTLARGVHTIVQVMAGGEPARPEEPGLTEVLEITAFHRSAFQQSR